MHDLQTLDKLNAEAVSRWKATPEHPHAVVHKMGLNVLGVIPVSSKAEAEDMATTIRKIDAPVGGTATVI